MTQQLTGQPPVSSLPPGGNPPTEIAVTFADVISGLLYRILLPGAAVVVEERSKQRVQHSEPIMPISVNDIAQGLVQNQIELEDAQQEASLSGYNTARLAFLERLAGEPPGSQTLLELWNRGVLTKEQVEQGLKESRLKNKYIEAIEELRNYLPSPSDVVRFQVREAYRDDIAAQFGTDSEYPDRADADFRKLGVSPELAHLYWRSHWELPSIGQAFTMLHRGLLTENEVKQLLEVQDVMPVWREKLMGISYNPLTRVDVRRMWELGVVDDNEVTKAYMDEGYTRENAQRLLQYTKFERTLPQLRQRYKNGWLTKEQLRSALIDIGLSTEKQEIVYERVVQDEDKPEQARNKDLTAAQIIKGIKMNIVTHDHGIEMLKSIGYDNEEARFLIQISLPDDKPLESPLQHEILVRQYLVSTGATVETIPQDVIDADNAYLARLNAYKNATGADREALSVALEAEHYMYIQTLARHHLERFAMG